MALLDHPHIVPVHELGEINGDLYMTMEYVNGFDLKTMLRKAAERTVSGLWDLIGKLVDIFQPAECANYFSSCGYDPE